MSCDVNIVGEIDYQDNLARICGGLTASGANRFCHATLIVDNRNYYTGTRVRVEIETLVVGFLMDENVGHYLDFLASTGRPARRVTCPAVIRGGWNRGGSDQGPFGVKLDLPGKYVRVPESRGARRRSPLRIFVALAASIGISFWLALSSSNTSSPPPAVAVKPDPVRPHVEIKSTSDPVDSLPTKIESPASKPVDAANVFAALRPKAVDEPPVPFKLKRIYRIGDKDYARLIDAATGKEFNAEPGQRYGNCEIEVIDYKLRSMVVIVDGTRVQLTVP